MILAHRVHVLFDGLKLLDGVLDRIHEHVVQELILDVDVPGYHIELPQDHGVQHLSLLLCELHVFQYLVVSEQGLEIASSLLELPVVHILSIVDVSEIVRVVFNQFYEFLGLLKEGCDIFSTHSSIIVIQNPEEGSDSLCHHSWSDFINHFLLENIPSLLVQS